MSEEIEIQASQVIFREGETSNGVYIVIEGKVQIYRTRQQDSSPEDVVIAEIQPGGMFGEMALIDQTVRSCSARTSEDSKLLYISDEAFHEEMSKLPPWALVLIKTMVRRLRLTSERLYELLQANGHLPLDPQTGADGSKRSLPLEMLYEFVAESSRQNAASIDNENLGRRILEDLGYCEKA